MVSGMESTRQILLINKYNLQWMSVHKVENVEQGVKHFGQHV